KGLARLSAVKYAETDDKGEFRLSGLPAGVFVVSVPRAPAVFVDPPPRNGPPPKTYYPGVATADAAEQLRLEAGDDRERIEFVVPAAAPRTDGQIGAAGELIIGNVVVGSQIPNALRAEILSADIGQAAAAFGARGPAGTGTPPQPATGTAVIRGRVVSTDGSAVAHA